MQQPPPFDGLVCSQGGDRVHLWDLLRDLCPRQGAALLLRAGFRLPRQTVAAVLGVPQNSVGWLCEQALETLRARAAVARANRR